MPDVVNHPSTQASAGSSGGAAVLEPAPRRIIVKEVNWLGDVVMSLPALRAVRRAWPQAHLAILIKRELAGLFDGAGWLDEVISYSVARGMRGLGDRRRIIGEIRARNFDLAVLFPNSFESALWTILARVPRRAGYATDGRAAMLTIRARPAPAALQAHQAHYWLEMVRMSIGADGAAADFAIEPAPAHLDKMRAWLDGRRKRPGARLVALGPGAAFGPAKEWPANHYARLIDILAERHGAECVLVGAPGERARCAEIAAASRAGAIIAAGETDIGGLMAALALADGFIGNDSGAMHAAAALGRPTVGIFGSTNPIRTGPMGPSARGLWRHLECSPCLARTCRFGHYNCLVEITPDEAARALAELGALD
ncbi:MAG TPA: lipopolysaccharide heptosyltransferase II [Candidatus Binataceae bacterium]|nr:lipopolysaccharide heptosyltransferase II [Candidatus Binataceae bacterium]